MTFFVLFFFPILIFLGSWQVIRGIEKTDIVEQHYMNKSLPVINEKDISLINEANLKYRTVNLYGEFGQESYLLDNRLYRQEAGYEIFTTFETSENNLFLVNRGWVSKEGFNYDEDVQIKEQLISIQGLLSPFTRFGLNLVNQNYEDTWPKLVQQIDYEAAKNDLGLGYKQFSYSIVCRFNRSS